MVDRLRTFLDRPLDPSSARAVLVLASAIFLGVAALFVFGASEPERPASRVDRPAVASPSAPVVPAKAIEGNRVGPRPTSTPRQDPQDVEGSAAARRAARALRTHRALQHVPYRRGELVIELVGARGHRAVLRVTAPTVPAARQGWRRFLRRYRDSGHSYIPLFRDSTGGRDGQARR